MEKILLICIVVLTIAILFYRPYGFGLMEGFNDWNLASSTRLENAHGSAPAGVNASPGRPQYEQDVNNPHVNVMYKAGNPQNVDPQYKRQPGFKY
jgi:hypothetical protein